MSRTSWDSVHLYNENLSQKSNNLLKRVQLVKYSFYFNIVIFYVGNLFLTLYVDPENSHRWGPGDGYTLSLSDTASGKYSKIWAILCTVINLRHIVCMMNLQKTFYSLLSDVLRKTKDLSKDENEKLKHYLKVMRSTTESSTKVMVLLFVFDIGKFPMLHYIFASITLIIGFVLVSNEYNLLVFFHKHGFAKISRARKCQYYSFIIIAIFFTIMVFAKIYADVVYGESVVKNNVPLLALWALGEYGYITWVFLNMVYFPENLVVALEANHFDVLYYVPTYSLWAESMVNIFCCKGFHLEDENHFLNKKLI